MTCKIGSKYASTGGGLSFVIEMVMSSPGREHTRGKVATIFFRQNFRQKIVGLLLFWHVLTTKTSCCASSNSSHILVSVHLFYLIPLAVT